jgi:hypothetical protein
MGGVATRERTFFHPVSASITDDQRAAVFLMSARSSSRRFVRSTPPPPPPPRPRPRPRPRLPPAPGKGAGHGAKLVAAVAIGAVAGNRCGIDVASVNEGANIGRSIVTIITAPVGNWPIVVGARVKRRFFAAPRTLNSPRSTTSAPGRTIRNSRARARAREICLQSVYCIFIVFI